MLLCLKQDSVTWRSPEDHLPYFCLVPYLAQVTVRRTFHFLACEIIYFVVIMPFISGMHFLLQSGSTSVPKMWPLVPWYCALHTMCVLFLSWQSALWEPPGANPGNNLGWFTTCLICALVYQLKLPQIHEATQRSHSPLKTCWI